jgi:hypothetical protein
LLDGSLHSATAAAWLNLSGRSWQALIIGPSERGIEAARKLAGDWDVVSHAQDEKVALTSLHALAIAQAIALKHGADFIVLGVPEDAKRPLALRLCALEGALSAESGLRLWAPLIGFDFLEVGRLALALGVSFEHTWDCLSRSACGLCVSCRDRERLFKQLGMPDPANCFAEVKKKCL